MLVFCWSFGLASETVSRNSCCGPYIIGEEEMEIIYLLINTENNICGEKMGSTNCCYERLHIRAIGMLM